MAVALSVDFGQGFSNAWSSVINIVPKLLAFAVIMLIGWFIAKAIAKILDAVLRRAGAERMAERAGMGRVLRDSAWDTTTIICKIVYYGILLVALQLAFGVFGPNPISAMIHSVVAWLPKAVVAVVIFVVAMAIANVVRDMLSNMLSATSYGRAVGAVAWGMIAFFGAIAALAQVGIATFVLGPIVWASVLALAGIAVVGVGGGLIEPMKSRWERMLATAESEGTRVRGSVAAGAAYQRGRDDALSGQPTTQPTTQPGTQPTRGGDTGPQPHGREPGTTA